MNKKTMRLGTLLLMAALFLSACGAGAGKSSDAPAGGSEASVAQVWKLTIVQPPEKLEYEEGETFDPAGVVINAKLKDGSMLENVAYEGIIVDQPLTRTSLFAKFVYGGETVEQNIKVTLKGPVPVRNLWPTSWQKSMEPSVSRRLCPAPRWRTGPTAAT